MAVFTRRDFLKSGLAATTLAGAGKPLFAARGTAADWVALGKSGVKVTRLAFGTGTYSGRVQRQLGQEGFNRLVRYGYDHGIRFFETAEAYGGMHQMLGEALKGLPRDSYRLMSKVTTRPGVEPMDKIDELRKQINSDYFDVLLLHFQHTATWPTDTVRWQDGILQAKEKKAVVTYGASAHGLPAVRRFPGNQWLQVALLRTNHNGSRMDGEEFSSPGPGNFTEVAGHVKQLHSEGKGLIGMKLIGEGTFTNRDDRQAAMRYAFNTAGVDAVTVGFKSAAEIDEAIENLNLALA